MKYWVFLLFLVSLFGFVFSSDFNGPIILTDFNFLETHYGPQEIDFYCWDNTTNDDTCISETTYSIDGIEKSFIFGEKILFNFIGTKQITVFAQNDQEIKNTKNFVLTINPIENKPQDEEEIEEGEEIIFEEETETIEQEQLKEQTPLNNSLNNNEKNTSKNQENVEKISENPINFKQNDISSSSEKTLEFFNLTQKDKIYIILLAIILVLLIAVMYSDKKVKK